MCNVRLSTCFRMFQNATHTIVVLLDTAWPWVSEAYGLWSLCAYFCAHKLIRARSYGLIVLQIVASSMLQNQKVALDTAWCCANDTYGLCCLCTHIFARINLYGQDHSYVVIPTYSPNRDSYGVLAANRNQLAARAFERVSVSVLWRAG